MISFLSLACGVMAGGGVYLILRKKFFDFLIGLTLIGHAINLSIFVASTSKNAPPSIIPSEQTTLAATALDPVPQALILTAIVISFGTTALLAVLFKTTMASSGIQTVDPINPEAT